MNKKSSHFKHPNYFLNKGKSNLYIVRYFIFNKMRDFVVTGLCFSFYTKI